MTFTLKHDRCVCAALALVLAGASPTLAQDVRVETQQQARTRGQIAPAEEETPEEVADPELGDIRLVARAPRPKILTLYTGQILNFTSNAFLARDDEQQAFFWNGRVGAIFIPHATRDFTPRLIFEQNWFRYDHLSELDFDSQGLLLDLKYDLNREDTWFVNLGYAPARLYSRQEEFYRYGLANVSLTHSRQIGEAGHLFVTAGAYSRHGDPSSSDRVAAYLNVVAIYNLAETVQLSAIARPEVQHYTHDPDKSSRADFNLAVGGAISLNPNKYLSVGATAAYVCNFSNLGERKYDLFAPSVVFNAQFAF
jgi:hypothetical protein